jgi:hypothetical protein
VGPFVGVDSGEGTLGNLSTRKFFAHRGIIRSDRWCQAQGDDDDHQRRNGSRRGDRHLEPTTTEKELNCTEHEEREAGGALTTVEETVQNRASNNIRHETILQH